MISQSREGTLALIMPLVWCHKCGGDRPAVALVTGAACGACRRPLAAISPLERYLSARIAGAVIEATREPGATGYAGLTPHSFSRKEAAGMTHPTDPACRPILLHIDDVITRHPDTGEEGEWTVVADPGHDGWHTIVDYRDADGKDGRFVIRPGVWVRFRTPDPTSPEVA